MRLFHATFRARAQRIVRNATRPHTLMRLALFAALLIVLQGAKCPSVPEMKTVDIAVVAEQTVELEFLARGGINAESDVVTINIEELRDDLEDADIEIDDIDTVVVHAISYGVTAYGEDVYDRRIEDGNLTVTRLDTAESHEIFHDVNVDVYPLLGELVPAPIEPGGIVFLNELLADVLQALKTGGTEGFDLQGTVSGVSTPEGRDTNFDWRVVVRYQVKGTAEIERPEF
ncbi:MAG: hypothetical protein KBD56_00330 [Candidatus Eisenbacteria bacterium]|nr:hypothetical protein [Candidatus Eisenbacteria bacterium]